MTSNRSCFRICCDLVISFICPHMIQQDRKFTCITNSYRAYAFWAVIIAITLTTSLLLGSGTDDDHPKTITPVADQMYYVDCWSNVWLDRMNLSTFGFPLRINAFLLDRRDRGICNQHVQTIKGPLSTTIKSDDIFVTTLTLDKGVRVSAKICMSDMGKIYMFKRRMDFLRCIRSDSWPDCGFSLSRWDIKADCKDYTNLDNPYLIPPRTISEYGEYHFVLYNRGNVSAPATIVFTKPVPNPHLWEKEESFCLNEWLCKFSLGGISESKGVCFEAVQSRGVTGRVNDEVKISCGLRLWLYMVAFLIVPLCVAIIGTAFICACCDKHTQPDPRLDIAGYSRRDNASYNRNSDITAPIYNSPTSGENNRQFDNVFEYHTHNDDTNRDNINRDRAQSLELEQATSDRPPSLSAPPPSYDDAMKDGFV